MTTPNRSHIDVSFPPAKEPQKLYKRVVKSCPPGVTVAEHARTLMQKGLDCTCPPKVAAPVPAKTSSKRNPGDGQ